MSGNNEDWKSHAFRHKVMMNINEALKKSGSPNNPQEIEQLIFQKANSRDNYMTMLARIILAFSSGHNKSQLTQPVNTGAMMDASVQPTALMNPEALKADNNTQILSKILTQPSPLSNLSAPSPQFYQTLSPATVQPGKPTKTSQARTPQVSQQTVGYPSPSPVIPSPSPVGHSPAPASSPQLVQSPSSAVATRVSGIPSVESPGSFNPPSISNPGSQESPVKLSDKEEQLYVEKLKQLSVYTEPLRKMIAKMQNDEDKDSRNLTKLKRLLSILGNSKERVPYNALLKVENVLVRRLGLKSSTAPIAQSFLQALNAKADSPQSNNTLYRMFGPTLATIYGPPICPPLAPKRRLDERCCSDTGLPQVVKCEIAQLVSKFTITHNNDGSEECKRMTLICSINDKTLPAVPSLSIRIPQDYPYSSPHCDTKDYESTPFLTRVKDGLEKKLSGFSKMYSLTALLLNWEACLRHVNARSGEAAVTHKT